MRNIKLGACALNQTPLDWEGNRDRILAAIGEAKQQGVGILCLPELCITGYGCEDAFLSSSVQETAIDVLFEIVPQTKGIAVCLGLPMLHQGRLFDTVCFAAGGTIFGFAAKHHLAGDGIHYEPRWFKAWPEDQRSAITLRGTEYPIGDLLFQCGDISVGFEICEDAWAADRPGTRHAKRGVDIILNPSASHFAFGKQKVRERIVLEGSRAFGAAYVYANLVGNEAGRAIYDGASFIAAEGELLAAGRRFAFTGTSMTTSVVNIERGRLQRMQRASLTPPPEISDGVIVRTAFEPPFVPLELAHPEIPQWETAAAVKFEEFTRAVALGLFDYLRKSFSRGFVVSLSGGADSAAIACLSAIAMHFAWHDLGRTGLLEKLSFIPDLENTSTPEQVVRQLLICVYQASENSSRQTQEAARAVATDLGAQFVSLNVASIIHDYCSLIENASLPALQGAPLSWEAHDLALQNIQARTRGPSVWLIANLTNALLLATSNRSEAAVGYTTMDGDTCGGLSPIAGIDKAFLRAWLRWAETDGPAGFRPLTALKFVNVQEPTAELRPAGQHQTDEKDLMPYDVLDAIERLAIRDKKSPLESFETLRQLFPEAAAGDLSRWTERFYRLWCRNQWKRERYAPSFHLDDENLDPKTWCRFPILSGGFKRELEALRRQTAEG